VQLSMIAITDTEHLATKHTSSLIVPLFSKLFRLHNSTGIGNTTTYHPEGMMKINLNKNLAIANRSRVSCSQNTLRAGMHITP